MDFSPLTDAIASRSYDKIADICDNLMLQVPSLNRWLSPLPLIFRSKLSISLFQVAAEGIAFQSEWPYAIHLLGHIYTGDM